MHKETFYSWEHAKFRLEDLRDCGLHYTVVVEYDNDLDLDYFVISWKK